MSEISTTEIDLDGKYLFVESEGYKLECMRYGEPWRDFIGDKAVHRLFSEAIRLKEINSEMYEAIEYALSVLEEDVKAAPNEQVYLDESIEMLKQALAKAEGRE